MSECQVCGLLVKLTKAGLVPAHGAGRGHLRVQCPGGWHPPLPSTARLESLLASAQERGDLEACYGHGRRLINIRKAGMSAHERAQVDRGEGELEVILSKLSSLFWLVEATAKYGKCRVCQKELSPEMFAHAKKSFTPQRCSPECHFAEIKKRFACCEKAEFSPCVCTYSFKCPDHGDTHIGTHD